MLLALFAGPAVAAAAPLPSVSVRTMIRDVRAWTAADGERIWRGFARAPIHIDLIADSSETLFCRAHAKGFTPRGRDGVTGCVMLSRPRVLDPNLTASLDIDRNVQAIAIGLPATLGMSSSAWRATLLHESFHQYQSVLPGYRKAVKDVRRTLHANSVDWPLTYPFPYALPDVGRAFDLMTMAARRFLNADAPKLRQEAIAEYVRARHIARTTVTPADWLYYEFQVGQEGVARWSEILLTERAGKRDQDMAAEARDRRAGVANSLNAIDRQGLRVWKRGAFYVYGAIEAEMLDRANPGWRDVYRRDPFGLGKQLDKVVVSAPVIS